MGRGVLFHLDPRTKLLLLVLDGKVKIGDELSAARLRVGLVLVRNVPVFANWALAFLVVMLVMGVII